MTGDYTIKITPLENLTTYSDTVDVTKYAKLAGFPTIKRDIDQGNFEIGVFNYGSIRLTFDNSGGIFNEPEKDGRSIFPIKRDKTKVTIIYTDSSGNEEISFKGLISDNPTTQNINNREIQFTILSLDSVFSKTSVTAGTVSNGLTYKQVFELILDVPTITNVVDYSAGNINPTLNLTVDDGSKFDTLTAKTALDGLLKASNSILLIDDSDNIIVRS